MQRRDLLRLLSAAAMTPLLPPDLVALARSAHPATGYALRTLNDHQNETVLAMIDIIIPATSTPGAKGARVNEFMDVILTEWATPEERRNFLDGLNDIDRQSNALYTKNFSSASLAQQTTLLHALDDAIDWSATFMANDETAAAGKFDQQMQGEFFRIFKTMTIHGYYTSEIGFTQELKLEIIPGEYHGCAPASHGMKN
jgi:Gluconate 2-dehydrogenase subunit 3